MKCSQLNWIPNGSVRIDYEISFNCYFCKPETLRTHEIGADAVAPKKVTEGLLDEIIGGDT